MNFIISIVLSSLIISVSVWVSKTNPRLAGFITAFPLSSMIALAISRFQGNSNLNTLIYAKSIFYSLPLTSLFFLPFLIADKGKWGFWPAYVGGVILLALGYGLVRYFTPQSGL